jgi:DUF4097 and DUF4098 domain-containing protein YvlB
MVLCHGKTAMIKACKLAGYTILALALFSTVTQAKTIEQTFAVNAGGRLVLETDSGALKIESHKGNSVEVKVDIKGRDEDQFEVKFEHNSNDVTINGERKSRFKGQRLNVVYHIKVLSHYNLDVDTSGGAIEIGDLKGEVKAHTSGGAIDLGHIDGLVKIKTSGGSIDIKGVSGTIIAHTSGGSMNATISKQPGNDSKLTTSGGSITVTLAKNIAVDLTAKTSGGEISSEFEVNGKVKTKSINGGGPKLVLKTRGGNVQIKAQ